MAKRKILPTRPPPRTIRFQRKRGAKKAAETLPLADLVDDEEGDDEDTERDTPGNPFGYYLRDVDAAPPLLTKREEIELGRRIAHRALALVRERLDVAKAILRLARRRKASAELAAIATTFLTDFNPDRLEGEALEEHLLRLYFHRGGDCPQQDLMFDLVSNDRAGAVAITRFVESNLRLVILVAKRYNRGAMSFPDLVQEGNLGLMHAVPRYDYRRGLRFSTFATWWIRHAISRALADKARTVRIPVHMTEAVYKIERTRNELATELGRTPTTEDLSKRTGIPADKLEKIRVWMAPPVSLDKTVGDEQDETLGTFVSYEEPDEEALATLVPGKGTAFLQEALQVLSPIERDVIFQRFGLVDDEERTFKEIGDRYNLSRERIRQIQNNGLDKLKRCLRQRFAAAI